jgi:hypothetical protein
VLVNEILTHLDGKVAFELEAGLQPSRAPMRAGLLDHHFEPDKVASDQQGQG